jgi:CheY-like chemotaxis protein
MTREKMSNKQIHLIDDDPLNNLINRKLITRILPEALVTEDIDAGNALERIKNDFTPDLILLDINMPGMNGWEFLESFQKMGKEISVYILTSSIDSADYRKAERYKQVKKYIEKPLNSQKITTLFI